MSVFRQIGLIAALVLVVLSGAHARDGWEGRPLVCNPTVMAAQQLETCKNWVANVRRPDFRGSSCCGEADAYITDDFVTEDGKFYAIITAEYPETTVTNYPDDAAEPQTTPAPHQVRKGQRVLIPKEKINRAHEDGGNPSGHSITFITPSGEVICFFGGTLS